MTELAIRPVSGAPSVAGGPSGVPRREPSRSRYPDETGFIERDGVRVFWERYGDGSPTILLMPTWSVLHSRHWKSQIAYLARHFRVVTYDGRGNGRSDRPTRTADYLDTEFAADAVAVMDATGTERAVAAGLSMGAGYAARLAIAHPERVLGLVWFGESIPFEDPAADAPEPGHDPAFEEPQPHDDRHWYNAHAWRRDWPGFAEWFAGQRIFSEPHSTKPIEDAVGWFLDTDPETIIVAERAPFCRPPLDWEPGPPTPGRTRRFFQQIRCPVLMIHGTDDHLTSIGHARRLAAALGARLVEVEGGGHAAIGRDPVLANLAIRDFVRSFGDAT